MPRKFLFFTEFGEILDVALHLKNEGEDVLFYIKDAEYKKVGDGMIEKCDDWHRCLGQGYVWVVDGCAHGNFQDWLRERGESVFGGSEKGDALENDRQLGQKLFNQLGFRQPKSKNFKSIEEALAFVKDNTDNRWILKQNGDAPKSINHMGKFDDNLDMIVHLEHLQKSWNETEYGAFDCDLMEVVKGKEIAASAFWNGHDWMRNSAGKVVGFLNGEEKKEISRNLGATTGEMGTTFLGVTEENELFQTIMLNPKLASTLEAAGFRGVFDINGCVDEDGDFIGFEPTCRFGVPASSYEFIEGLVSSTADLIESVAKGQDKPVEVREEVGMVMVVASKPFPIEAHLEDDQTSMGEILWFLDEDGQESLEMTGDQQDKIHLYNFFFDEDSGSYKVATDSGYLLTVTHRGRTVSGVRNDLIYYIDSNLYISGMKYRDDIGERIEQFIAEQQEEKEIIGVDFDGVIRENVDGDIEDGEMIEGAEKAIKALAKKGYSIRIFTARTDIHNVLDWLDDNFSDWRESIDDVSNTKPPSTVYIDDKALRFESWEQVGKDLFELL